MTVPTVTHKFQTVQALCAIFVVLTYFEMWLTPLKWVLAMADSAVENC